MRGEGATAPKEKREAAAEAATARLASFQEAAASVGCVPMLLGAADCTGCGPDEQVSALLLAHLFARVTQLAAHAQAAGVLQRAWRVRQSGSAPWPRFRRAVAEIKRKHAAEIAERKALAERFYYAQQFMQQDPWSERASAGVHSHEFAPLAEIA